MANFRKNEGKWQMLTTKDFIYICKKLKLDEERIRGVLMN